MAKEIIIIGGLGNGSVIANAITDANKRGYKEWVVCGFLNDREKKNSLIDNYPVLGKLEDLKKYINEEYYFINTIYKIDGQKKRINIFKSLNIPRKQLATFIHPLSYIAPNVELGYGTVIMPNVSISSGTKFGDCCLVMVGATIGHDNKIGSHCHFAAQSCVGAYLNIKDGVHVGLNATIRENLILGNNSTLGMGSVLTKSIDDNEVWVGVPAKFLRFAK